MQSESNDVTLVCADCNEEFLFTEEEQARYAERNFEQPKRCPRCRASRRRARQGGRGNSRGGPRKPRTMTKIICDSCGKESEVPFEPKEDRPVYCPECYRANQEG